MALVLWEFCCNASIASAVGRISNLAPLGFSLHVVHHRESAVSAGANYQALALPRNSSLIESGVCLNASRNFLDAFFLPLADAFTIDHHIVLMSDAVDPDRAERKVFETHCALRK